MAESKLDISAINKFTGENYHQWKFQMFCALKAKGVFKIVKGETKKPVSVVTTTSNNSEQVEEWIRQDAIAMFTITSAMGLNQISLVENCESSAEIISKLDSIYEQKTETNKMLVHERFHQYRMATTDTVAQHIAKIETLARNIKEVGDSVSDLSIITKILSTLPLKYRGFRQAWLSMPEDRQTIQNLTARLLDEEASLTSLEQEDTALAITIDPHRRRLDNSQASNQLGMPNIKKITCYACQRKGHYAKNCRNPKKSQNREPKVSELHNQSNFSAFNTDLGNCIPTVGPDEIWHMDSGASRHMTGRKEYFASLDKVDEFTVKLGDDFHLKVAGTGDIKIQKCIEGVWYDSVLKNVLYVPGLKKNLFSEGTLTRAGFKIIKSGDRAEIFEGEKLVASGILQSNNVYKMLFRTILPDEANVAVQSSLKIWHERLGHINVGSLKEMVSKGLAEGVDFSDEKDFFCEGCAYGKQHKMSFGSSDHQKLKAGELIYSDLCGPMSVNSISGARYFVSFKDDHSGYRVVFFIKHKNDTLQCFKEYVGLIKTKFGRSVKILHSDNGTEYVNQDFKGFLSEKGIIHEKSAPFCPPQNGRVERDMRTIVESARSMLFARQVPLELWAEAVNTAVYILNRTATVQTPNSTPFEQWTGKRPTLSHLRTFGAQAYALIPEGHRKKLEQKCNKVILVGYDNYSNNYRLFDPISGRVKVSANVLFDESGSDCSYPKSFTRIEANEDLILDKVGDDASEDFEERNESKNENDATHSSNDSPAFPYSLRSRENIKPPSRYSFEASYVEVDEPQTFEDAMNSPNCKEWSEAIREELDAHETNNTWTTVPLPKNKKPIGSRWVFKIKRNSTGDITRYKARLCAKGFNQKEGIDYNETFSPTTRYDSIRVCLSIAVQLNYEITQFDVKTAFLNGELQEEIYMTPPDGIDVKPPIVCRLNKSIYGLKQASRCWNQKFDRFIKAFGFSQFNGDKCIYRGEMGGEKFFLILFVDDGLVMGSNSEACNTVIEELRRGFEITISKPEFFVGMQISYDRENGTLFINQSMYIDQIIKRFRLENANISSVPANPHIQLSKPDNQGSIDVPYREAVGALIFISIVTRPDIAFAVGQVARFCNNFDTDHWNAVKEIIKYLKGTPHHGILYRRADKPPKLIGFSDSDYAGDLDTRRSTTGYVFTISTGPVTWNSQRQPTVALSSTEAEFMAASAAAKEAMWLRVLFRDIFDEVPDVTTIFMDNQSAIRLTRNPEYHKRTKHIDIRYHYVRERYENGDIEVAFIPTQEQTADIFTKSLSRESFLKFRDQLVTVLNEE